MSRLSRWIGAVAVLVVVAALAGQASAAEKINVLIIDGQNGHPWKATTPVLKEMLLKTDRFNVDVATSPAPKAPAEAWEKFRPDPSKYGVVLVNYCGQDGPGGNWPAELKQAFEKYVQDGGGMVFYHFTVAAFPNWPEWSKMVGMGWHPANFGGRVYLDDEGKAVRMAKGEGPGNGHGPSHSFEIIVRLKDHPIMKGLPEKWQHVTDELYHGMRGPCENMTLLASAFSAKDKGGTGCNEPMMWTVSYGKGRAFVYLPGHDGKVLEAPDSQALIPRGCEWAATGEVTLPAPADFSAPK